MLNEGLFDELLFVVVLVDVSVRRPMACLVVFFYLEEVAIVITR